MKEQPEGLIREWAEVLRDITVHHLDDSKNVTQEGLQELAFAYGLIPPQDMVSVFMLYANLMFPIDMKFANR